MKKRSFSLGGITRPKSDKPKEEKTTEATRPKQARRTASDLSSLTKKQKSSTPSPPASPKKQPVKRRASITSIISEVKKKKEEETIVPGHAGLIEAVKDYIKYVLDAPPEWMEALSHTRISKSVSRYEQFLQLKAKNQETPLWLPPDIVLVYRAHLHSPVQYCKTCFNLFGEVRDLEKEAQESSRSQTKKLWKEEFQDQFELAIDEEDLQSEQFPAAIAIYDFKAQTENEVSLIAGDSVVVLKADKGGWCLGKCRGVTGYFPRTHIQFVL